ncbi:DoxX family protein [Pontibacter sp. SGAir0037]|uniref:DoxX family protein n=1 Tax=Pontibacter sp. SGAir0037 TaxID=2571030 RepID=UPI0010CD410D|nr:DoxX family protein [Pontibacter sp. SGAir0037]QCR22306.1 hypothetical protein C1N53_08130 [Pontibacter sp. SGAir0037]
MAKQINKEVLNVILWIVQVLLTCIFTWAGVMKLLQPDELPWLWVKEDPGLVTVSGIADLIAGIGLTVPSLLRIKPQLTIYAAYGTIALMISASVFHMMRGEGNQIGFNMFMLVAAIFIIWGRRRKARIGPK